MPNDLDVSGALSSLLQRRYSEGKKLEVSPDALYRNRIRKGGRTGRPPSLEGAKAKVFLELLTVIPVTTAIVERGN